MVTSILYRPISLSAFIDTYKLKFSIFLKILDRYILYKQAGELFNSRDIERLERSNTEFVYLRQGDMEEFNKSTESLMLEIITDKKYSISKKAKAIFSVSTNYVEEIYNNSKNINNDVDRCRLLISNMIESCFNDSKVFEKITNLVQKGRYEYAHSVHVTTLSLIIAHLYFNLNKSEMNDLGTGAILHDIGKIFLPDNILNKPGSLTAEEKKIMNEHPEQGYDYLKESINNEMVLDIVRGHHERIDGNGYPRKLIGDQLGRNVRIVSASDIYCALISDRVYRKKYTYQEALTIIKEEFGDEALGSEIIKALDIYVLGS